MPIDKLILNFFRSLDLERRGLELVKKYFNSGDYNSAIQELRSYMRKRKKPLFFWSWKDKDEIVETVNQGYLQERDREINYANRICKHIFTFEHRWDMEQSLVPYNLGSDIDWAAAMPNGDLEWNLMLNRHGYWAKLGRAYWYTGNEAYVKEWVCQLTDFIEKTKSHPVYTWSDLQVGIRAREWVKSYYYMLNSPYLDSMTHLYFLDSLRKHAEHLFKRSEFRKGNWAFFMLTGLATTAILFPEFRNAQIWFTVACNKLTDLSEKEILIDGLHNELVPMYHNEIVLCLFEFLHLVRLNNVSVQQKLYQALEGMIQADIYFTQPDSRIPTFGDSDSFDARDLITAGALLFKRDDFKQRGYPELDYSNFWYFGKAGISDYERIPGKEPEAVSYLFGKGQWCIMRGDWSQNSLYLFFNVSDMDIKGVDATHSHADNLGIIIHALGKPLLVDSGRYIYSDIYYKIFKIFKNKHILLYGKKMFLLHRLLLRFWKRNWEFYQRKYFKSTSAHNTVVVDKQDQSVYLNEARWAKKAKSFLEKWVSLPNFDFACGYHDGYRQLRQPVSHYRKILFIKKEYWLVTDLLKGSGFHKFDCYFHLNANKKELIRKENAFYTDNESGPGLYITHLEMHLENNGLNISVNPGWFSEFYNSKKKITTIRYSKECFLPVSFYTLIYPLEIRKRPMIIASLSPAKEDSQELIPSKAAFIEISIDNRKDYCLVSHDAEKLRQFGPFKFNGSVCFLRMNALSEIEKITLIGGNFLSFNDSVLIRTEDNIDSIDIDAKNGSVKIFNTEKVKKLEIYLPNCQKVSLRGEGINIVSLKKHPESPSVSTPIS